MRNTNPITRAIAEKNRQAVRRQNHTDLVRPESNLCIAFDFSDELAGMPHYRRSMNLTQPLRRGWQYLVQPGPVLFDM
jgi:hypothetical protein